MLLAIAAFSLVGLPLTGGFWGKYYLLAPIFGGFSAVQANAGWLMTLAILILVNSAISAVYYLSIVGALFNRAEPDMPVPATRKIPLVATVSIVLSAASLVFFGVYVTGTRSLAEHAGEAAAAVDTVSEAQDAPTATASR
jgi:NADH-quinone oxidoreductase subunit N